MLKHCTFKILFLSGGWLEARLCGTMSSCMWPRKNINQFFVLFIGLTLLYTPHNCIPIPLIQSPLKSRVAYLHLLDFVFLLLYRCCLESMAPLSSCWHNDPKSLELVCKPLRACVVCTPECPILVSSNLSLLLKISVFQFSHYFPLFFQTPPIQNPTWRSES